MISFPCDVAISAVASDGALVAELSDELSPRLTQSPEWHSEQAGTNGTPDPLLNAEHSRVVVVLHQHLWQHDGQTLGDAALLRARLIARSDSVCVLTLDDAPLASWLGPAPRYNVSESGRAGITEFVAGVVAAAGGVVKPKPDQVVRDDVGSRWPDPPTPFLAQPRAQSALRHELDDIVAVLKREIESARAVRPDQRLDLHVLPHRVIVRLDDVAVSFSWVSGRSPTVSDGRLLVIAWHGVASGATGADTLRSASPLRERIYAAEAGATAAWRWRADDDAKQPYASGQLVADWLARAFIVRDA